MQIWSQDLITSMLANKSTEVTLTFNILPDACTLTYNGTAETTSTQAITKTAHIGDTVTYSIAKSGYNTVSDSFLVIGPRTIGVTLNQREMFVVSVDVLPSAATPVLTCSESEFTQSGRTITVPLGSTVSYCFSYTSTADGNTIPTSAILTTDPITAATTIQYTMTVSPTLTVYKDSVNGDNIITDECTIEFNGSSAITTFNCTADVYYSVTGYKGYAWIDPQSASEYRYIAKDVNGVLMQNTSVVLQKKAYSFGVVLSSNGQVSGVTIHAKVNDGAQQTLTSGQTISVYLGDTIWWETYYNGRQRQTDTTTLDASAIDTSNNWTYGNNGLITANPVIEDTCNVSISATPSEATVTLVNNTTGVTYTGNPASATVTVGNSISYYAMYAGVTSATTTTTISSSSAYTDSIALDPTLADIAVVTTTQSILLYPGVYGYICVGGGGAGATGSGSTTSTSTRTGQTTTNCGRGGNGGCSGYITKGTFTVTTQGAYTFTVGTGGTGATALASDGPAGGTTSLIAPDGTVISTAGGAEATPYLPNASTSYAGGSGGGCYAAVGHRTLYSSGSMTLVQNGSAGNGGAGGGNGYSGTSTTSSSTLDYYGTGYYNTTKTVGGTAGTTLTVTSSGSQIGNPGNGGTGLSSIQSTLTTRSSFTSIVNGDATTYLQTLYNAIAGGGAGGCGNCSAGGPGGGGAGWSDGSNGSITSGNVMQGGSGGNGAILYARIGWE